MEQIVASLRDGDRRALAQAITLIESQRPDHRESASRLLKAIMPLTGSSFRIGISGQQGSRVAVLTVDPSSPLSGGAIMGDKTRMESLARQENAFIRPSAAGGMLGGVTKRTREALLLCEAAAFDLILVETVGIGQSETAVAQMTDMFILLLLPGSGDELQGIKRGVTELADLILINKADGDLTDAAKTTAADYQNALKFLQPRTEGWAVPVNTCSALEQIGVADVWATVQRYRNIVAASNQLEKRRGLQAKVWFWEEVSESLLSRLRGHPQLTTRVTEIEHQVRRHEVPPTIAAQELVNMFLSTDKS